MSQFIPVRVRSRGTRRYLGVARARVMALSQRDGDWYFPGYRVVWRRRAIAQIVPVKPGGGRGWRVVFAGDREPYPGEPFMVFGAAVGFAVRKVTGEV